MTVLLEAIVPESGRLSLHVHTDLQINISAADAQRRVTQYVHNDISSQMHGKEPVLSLSARAYWQVPVHLTFPSIGDAGQVGVLHVDVETGEIQTNETIVEEIERNAESLARRLAPLATR